MDIECWIYLWENHTCKIEIEKEQRTLEEVERQYRHVSGPCSVAPPPLPPSHLKDKTRTREGSKREVLFTPMERWSERQCNWDAAGVEMKK